MSSCHLTKSTLSHYQYKLLNCSPCLSLRKLVTVKIRIYLPVGFPWFADTGCLIKRSKTTSRVFEIWNKVNKCLARGSITFFAASVMSYFAVGTPFNMGRISLIPAHFSAVGDNLFLQFRHCICSWYHNTYLPDRIILNHTLYFNILNIKLQKL